MPLVSCLFCGYISLISNLTPCYSICSLTALGGGTLFCHFSNLILYVWRKVSEGGRFSFLLIFCDWLVFIMLVLYSRVWGKIYLRNSIFLSISLQILLGCCLYRAIKSTIFSGRPNGLSLVAMVCAEEKNWLCHNFRTPMFWKHIIYSGESGPILRPHSIHWYPLDTNLSYLGETIDFPDN